jgi:hypothetical protein
VLVANISESVAIMNLGASRNGRDNDGADASPGQSQSSLHNVNSQTCSDAWPVNVVLQSRVLGVR